LQRLLRENVQEADEALKATEKEFIALLSAPSQRPAADIFFSDLDLTYQRALTELKAFSNEGGVALAVKFQRSQRSQYPVVAEAVFRAFEQNELAYNLVADTGALTFDLDVKSIPVGADVSYGRRGDSSFQHLQDETNSTIKGLPFAIWLVRFEKPGYAKQEREHNPYVEKNHVVVVELASETKKLGK
jgi:hypothetical protein